MNLFKSILVIIVVAAVGYFAFRHAPERSATTNNIDTSQMNTYDGGTNTTNTSLDTSDNTNTNMNMNKDENKTYVKKNSHWKHCRRELYTKVEANLTMDCINFINASTDKGPKKRRSLKAKYELAGYYYYYQANHLIGTYKDVSCSVTQTIVR